MSMSMREAAAFSALVLRVAALEAKQKAGPVSVSIIKQELSPSGNGKRRGPRPKQFTEGMEARN